MALSIKIKTVHYSAELVLNTSIRKPQMLCMLASHDAKGDLLDKCEGNVKAAFAMMLCNRMYFLHQVHLDRSVSNLSRRFNLVNRQLPLAFTGNEQAWGFKLINMEKTPAFSFQMEVMA
ncbi:hypothetical protein CJF42_25190 [Pseudoalteromonas sp. NBT06-2]|uniref:hypothetical protein n=1 Tax=Pseudoalteromonas sp. NBT06-2 TaxID=2025950 RepID=UPI000BA511ED|nr:hypothetical protein [Pseudoalteromonas sp. NBT06-2]PAJ71721.1 hypothetical protein CJF42_25190 [Pseudoalteromonas sp. NBT06-2]